MCGADMPSARLQSRCDSVTTGVTVWQQFALQLPCVIQPWDQLLQHCHYRPAPLVLVPLSTNYSCCAGALSRKCKCRDPLLLLLTGCRPPTATAASSLQLHVRRVPSSPTPPACTHLTEQPLVVACSGCCCCWRHHVARLLQLQLLWDREVRV